jgi:hypothetical protein
MVSNRYRLVTKIASDVIECEITMIAASDIINAKLEEGGGLPSLY